MALNCFHNTKTQESSRMVLSVPVNGGALYSTEYILITATAKQQHLKKKLFNTQTCPASSVILLCSLSGFVVLKCLKQIHPFRTVPVTQ